jgi:hypothetical protein
LLEAFGRPRLIEAMYWFLLIALGLLAVGGLMLVSVHRSGERRVAAIEKLLEELRRSEDVSSDAARRAHVRLDNQQRQLDALAKELGWADDRTRTKMLTGVLPVLPPSDEP